MRAVEDLVGETVMERARKRARLIQQLDDDQRRLMAKQVLQDWKSSQDEDLCRKFKEQIKAYAPPPKGFRSTEKALEQSPLTFLNDLCRLLAASAPIVDSVVDMWMAIHDPLCEAVVKHLGGEPDRQRILDRSRRTGGPGAPRDSGWTRLRSGFDQDCPGMGTGEEIDLMFCLMAGNEDSLPLGRWLASLKDLSEDDPLWEGGVERFAQQIGSLAEQKKKDRQVFASVRSRFASLEEQYRELLSEFLGLEPLEYCCSQVSIHQERVEPLYGKLSKRLKQLAEKRKEERQAGSYEQQKAIREKLDDLVGRVVEVHGEIRSAFAPWDTDGEEDHGDEEDSWQVRELEQSVRELEERNRELDARNESGRSDLESAREELKGIRKERDELRRDLEASRRGQKMWQDTYHLLLKQNGDPLEGERRIESLRDAVEFARQRYSKELAFELNRHSRVEKNRFEKPEDALRAMEWLAVIYRNARMGEKIDLDRSLRENCSGWKYTPHQNESTMKTHEAWYQTTTEDGRVFKLEPHLGTGKDKDDRYTIRMAFAWDEQASKVVIGYIGMHQRTA